MSELDEQFAEQETPAVEPEEFAVVPQTSEPEVVAVSEPEPVSPVEIAKSKNEEPVAPAPAPASAPAPAPFEKVVLMSSLKFQAVGKRSLSVAYVQERLVELGFYDAGADKRGWFSVGTKKSLSDFSKSDVVDISVIQRLFDGTAVKVLP